MLKVYDKNLEPIAILENAYAIGYERKFNEVWNASFKLPMNDPKTAECEPFNFIELTDNGDQIGVFRIMPTLTVKDDNANEITYTCEHVLSTLLDDVLFRYHQTTNWTTRQNIEYLLDQQSVTRWQLGDCDFTRYFHYKWENENLLSALLSIPRPFDAQYQFTYDTTTYPWTINLVEPTQSIDWEIRYAKNMRGIEKDENPTDIVTRIYPLGAGEGVNQLGITDVNPTGLPYIDAATIGTYGVRSYVWADKRFENADSLFNNAKSLLTEWSVPKVTYRVNTIDLRQLGGFDDFREGSLGRIIDEDLGVIEARVVSESNPDITGQPDNIQLEIANKSADLATTQRDMKRKIEINEVYAQGSTNLDSHNYEDNCDANNPATVRFFLPDDLVRVNTMNMAYEVSEFRSYSQATEGGGSTTVTSASGGGTTATSSSGGGVSTSTASGGGSTQTSTSGGSASPTTTSQIFGALSISSEQTNQTDFSTHVHTVKFTDEFDHSHTVNIPGHTHNVSIPSHTHNFSTPNHSHSVTIPNHSHNLTLPDHTHDIKHGIYKLSTLPSAVEIKVDGTVIPQTELNGQDIDLIPYLSKDSEGKINRGQWHTVEVTPKNLARVTVNIVSRLFISSHIGGNY